MCLNHARPDALHSPSSAVRAWEAARTAAHRTDLTRRFVHVLFVSEDCHRAILAERLFFALAERRSRSRRLLVHSAGLDAIAGGSLPRRVLGAAAAAGINLADANHCARFDVDDFEFYDFILALDQAVLERVTRTAVDVARNRGGPLADWERKIRLAADFTGERARRPTAGAPLDIPRFPDDGEMAPAVDAIKVACGQVLDALIVAGL